MSNSLSLRLESSNTDTSDPATAVSPGGVLDATTGNFTASASDEVHDEKHGDKFHEEKMHVTAKDVSMDFQQKRKLLDEIESLKKLKINELEELARIQQYKNLCIQDLNQAKEQVVKEKEYLKKLKEDSDKFKHQFATQKGAFARLIDDPSLETMIKEEQSRPQSHPSLQGLRDRYKYHARMMQQAQPPDESSNMALNFKISKRREDEGNDHDVPFKERVAAPNSTVEMSKSPDSKEKDMKKLTASLDKAQENKVSEYDKAPNQEEDKQKTIEKASLGIVETTKLTLNEPEWYKTQHCKAFGLETKRSSEQQAKPLVRHKEDDEDCKEQDLSMKTQSKDSTNYNQMSNPNEKNSERPKEKFYEKLEPFMNDTKHKSGEDDDIRLIHEKFKDRITVTRESEGKTMENKRGSVDMQVTKPLIGRENDPNKMQSVQPRGKEDTDQSLDLTRMTRNDLETNNKSQDNTIPKEQIKETHYRHILPASAPLQHIEKSRSNLQASAYGSSVQAPGSHYTQSKILRPSFDQQSSFQSQSDDEKSKEEFKQKFEQRQKQLEQDQHFKQKPTQPTFSPSGGARVSSEPNAKNTWKQPASYNPPLQASAEKLHKSYVPELQQQQAMARKMISEQPLTPQRIPNPSANPEFVSPKGILSSNVSQQSQQPNSAMQPQLRPPHQPQFRGPSVAHSAASPQQIGSHPQHPQMQGMPSNRPPMPHLYPSQHPSQKGYPNQHDQFYAAAMTAATAAAAAASSGMDPKSAAANAARQLALPQSTFNSNAFQNMAAAAAAAALATCGGRNSQGAPYPAQIPRHVLPLNDRSAQFGPTAMDIRRNDPAVSTPSNMGNSDEHGKSYPAVDLGHMATTNRNNAMWFAMQQKQQEQLQKLQHAQQAMKPNSQLIAAHQQGLSSVSSLNDRQQSGNNLNVHDKHATGMHAASNLAYAQQQHLLSQQQRQQQQQHVPQPSPFERQPPPHSRHPQSQQHEATSHQYDRAATLTRQDRPLTYGRPIPPANYANQSAFSHDTATTERSWRSQQPRNPQQTQEIASSAPGSAPANNHNNGVRVSPKSDTGHRTVPSRSGSRGSELGFSDVVASARNSITRIENTAVSAAVADDRNNENGRRPFGPDVVCKICKKEASFMCSACRGAHYCSLECQVITYIIRNV